MHKFPSIEAVRRLAPGAPALSHPDLRLDRDHDLLGDLVLQVEDVIQTAIEAIGPEVIAAGRIDELCRDPDPVARLADTAFDDVANTQFASHLGDIDGFALVDK